MTATRGNWDGLGRRLLALLPGLILPVASLTLCARSLVHETASYYALPLSVRTSDGGPLGWDAGMDLAGVLLVLSLIALLPPLLVCLPKRLRMWQLFAAIAVQQFLLFTALISALEGDVANWGRLALYAYVPTLGIVRLVLQARAERAAELPPVSDGVSEDRLAGREPT